MDLKDKAVKAVFWQFFNVGFKAIVHILYLAIMARFLDKEIFGIYALVSAAMLFVTLFSEFGIGAALIQRRAFNQSHLNVAFFLSLTIAIMLYTLLYFSAPFIAQFYEDQMPVSAFRWIGLNLIINSFSVVSRSLIIRDLKFKNLFFIDALPLFAGNIVCGVALAYFGYGLWALIIPTTVVTFASCAMAIILKPVKVSLRFSIKELSDLLQFGGVLIIIRITNFLGNFIDKIILGKLSNFQLLGIYERAQRISQLPDTFLGDSLDGVIFSGISRAETSSHVRQLYLRPLGLLSLVLFPLGYLVFTYASLIIDVLLGNGWQSATPILQVFAFALPFRTMIKISDAYNRAKKAFTSALTAKLVFVLLASICTFLLYGSIQAVAFSIAAASVIQWLFMTMVIMAREKIDFARYIQFFSPGFMIALLFYFKCFVLRYFLGLASETSYFMVISLASDLILVVLILYSFPQALGRANIDTLLYFMEYVKKSFLGKSKMASLVEGHLLRHQSMKIRP